MDPWVGVREYFLLSVDLKEKLQAHKIYVLADSQAQQPQHRGRSGWKSSQELALSGDKVGEWNIFVSKLVFSFVHLEAGEQDKLIWTKNGVDEIFSAKLGYEAIIQETFQGEKRWWWSIIWKIYSPLKNILTLWFDLNGKLLTC